jgi:hypothetical protein
MSPLPLDDFEDLTYTDTNTNTNDTAAAYKKYMKSIRQQNKLIPPPSQLPTKEKSTSQNQISYDDILASMNLCVKNGKLYRLNDVPVVPKIPVLNKNSTNTNMSINNKQTQNTNNTNNNSLTLQKIQKRNIWLQQLQKQALEKRKQQQQQQHTSIAKSKKFDFTNHNDIHMVDGPKADLNAKFLLRRPL